LTSAPSAPYASAPTMASVRNLRDYLLIRDAASFLGVSEATLRNWDREGKIAAYRNPINGYRLFRRADLETFLKKIARSGRQRVAHRRGGVA
jgi:MerR family transcriptional regulator, copper efflux regulator